MGGLRRGDQYEPDKGPAFDPRGNGAVFGFTTPSTICRAGQRRACTSDAFTSRGDPSHSTPPPLVWSLTPPFPPPIIHADASGYPKVASGVVQGLGALFVDGSVQEIVSGARMNHYDLAMLSRARHACVGAA